MGTNVLNILKIIYIKLMEDNIFLERKITSFDLCDTNILNFDANSEIIALKKESDCINVYSMDTKKEICFKQFKEIIAHFQFHPKYYNVLTVSLENMNVVLLNIDIINKKIEEKVIYKSKCHGNIYKTLFSPYKNGTILATLYTQNISIWDMKSYYHIYNINFCNKKNKLSLHPDIKWNKSGEYLIFQRYKDIIEVFELSSKTLKYYFENDSIDYFFYEKMDEKDDEKEDENIDIQEDEQEDGNIYQLIYFDNKNISIYDIENNKEISIMDCDINKYKKSIFDENNYLIYIMDKNKIYIYDLKSGIKEFEYKVNQSVNFYLLKDNSNDKKLYSKLIIYSKDKKFEILSIYKENNQNIFDPIEEMASHEFWENSIENIDDNYDYLSYEKNRYENDEIKVKKYLSIKEINDEAIDSLNNKTLEEKRELVIKNMMNFNENENIENTYINYIKNIIMDNTNDKLLLKYLIFLNKKDNQKQLKKIYNMEYETLEDEISQFQFCFDKIILKQELEFIKIKNEKEYLINQLNEVLNINNMKDLEIFIDKEKNIFDKFRFNQPISFENRELYFCKCRLLVLYSLKNILKYINSKSLNNMKYSIKKVLSKNLLESTNTINEMKNINLCFILITCPQKELLTDYNLNLIDDKGIFVTEEELIRLGFKYNKTENIFEYKNSAIILKKDEIKLYNLENIKLVLKQIEIGEKNEFKYNYELYKYEPLLEYYKKQFDEEKVIKFISKILTSNVIKDSFKLFYGNDIKYPFLDDEKNKGIDKALKYLNKYFTFIPFKIEDTSAVTDKFSLESFLFLNSDLISIKNNKDTKNSIYFKINRALINGSIVKININETNHNFHNYFYLSKNGKESLKTPRKIKVEGREGGVNMENLLFGQVLNKLTVKQALYILNEDNYNKSINQFRNDFIELKGCECKDIFKDYYEINKNLNISNDYTVIRFKSNQHNIPYISISLKNDVLGFIEYHNNNNK